MLFYGGRVSLLRIDGNIFYKEGKEKKIDYFIDVMGRSFEYFAKYRMITLQLNNPSAIHRLIAGLNSSRIEPLGALFAGFPVCPSRTYFRTVFREWPVIREISRKLFPCSLKSCNLKINPPFSIDISSFDNFCVVIEGEYSTGWVNSFPALLGQLYPGVNRKSAEEEGSERKANRIICLTKIILPVWLLSQGICM